MTRTAVGLRAAAEQHRAELVQLCADLVAAPSVNPPGDTRAAAEVVRAWLEAHGLPARVEAADPAMPSVLAELDSGRPGHHLVLNGHLDTMPPGDESAWSVPVRELTRRDGRLHGLGMGNMKGAVAAMLHALLLLAARRDEWSGRVTFSAVSDEVVFGDAGAAHLLAQHPELAGDGLLSGEGPGFRRLAVAEKGVLWLRLRAEAAGGHSSAVRAGDSATARLAAAVLAVDALTGREAALPPGLAGRVPRGDDRGTQLTANVGTVRGGSFIGQVATAAEAEADLRLPPGTSADEAERLVRDAVAAVPGVTVERIKGWDASWTDPDDDLVRAFRGAVRELRGAEPTLAVRLPASDASRWRRLGTPALCYGPQPTLSAGVDDWAEEEEVLDCVALYARAALGFLGDAAVHPGRAGPPDGEG